MKRRLFWKILVAFWLTFLAITQGVWLLFELNRSERPMPEPLMAEQVGPVVLTAGAQAINQSGPEGFAALIARLPEDQRRRLALEPSLQGTQERKGGPYDRYVRVTAAGPDGRSYRLSYGYRSEPEFHTFVMLPLEPLFAGLLGGLLFSIVLAWYLTEPINRLRGGFDRLAHGDLEVRLGASIGRRRDEIADLAHHFDLMAQRLEQLVSARDRLLHDISHELRSPLARLQLAIGLARQGRAETELTLERIEREARRLDMLVEELLALTRAETGEGSNEDYFDLAGIVESVTEDARFEALSSGVDIMLLVDLPPEHERPLLRGNAELVRRAIDNIVRNALRFSRSGHKIEIRIGYDEQERSYSVEIADDGPGVAEQDLAAIFDPFTRGEDGGAGLGLGLSIASRAVMAHGGTIEARNRPERGLAVLISLSAGARGASPGG